MSNYNPSWGTQAAATIDNTSNIIATSSANKKTREWNEKILNQQRSWALEDWNAQNAYNTPQAQMQRYKDAGLSPHLIYGQMQTAQPIRSTEGKSMEYKPLRVETGEHLQRYQAVQNQAAQMDNIKAQNTLIEAETALKAMQMGKLGIDTAKTQFDLNMASELKNTSMEFARERLVNLQQDTGVKTADWRLKHNRAEYEADLHLGNMVSQALGNQQKGAQLKQMEVILENLKNEGFVKKLDADLASKGIRPQDPLYYRAVMTVLNEVYNRYFKK